MDKTQSRAPGTEQVKEATSQNVLQPSLEASGSRARPASIPSRPCKKHAKHAQKRLASRRSKQSRNNRIDGERSDSSDETSSSSDRVEEDDTSTESESSELDSAKLKAKAKKAKAKAKTVKADQRKKQRGGKKKVVAVEDFSDDEDIIVEERDKLRLAKRKARMLVDQQLGQVARGDELDELALLEDPARGRMRGLRDQVSRLNVSNPIRPQIIYNQDPAFTLPGRGRRNFGLLDDGTLGTQKLKVATKKHKRASKAAYKRVDQLWDQSIHNYKLTETIDDPGVNEWDQYIFTVRRRFDWEHKYLETLVDIKSKPLKECLQHIMADVKGVSLVQDTPHIDPNMLFLYLEECRTYQKRLKEEAENASKKTARKAAASKAQHLKILVKYLDKDYAETMDTLYPMLDNGIITFDLLWALYKPNTIAYCSTYGDQDHARAFKIDLASKESHFMKGSWYQIEGKYLEYDGKGFGMGTMHTDVQHFPGARKITSLECFPLQYHCKAEAMKTELIERGKKFVALKGMNYRSHKGMAYAKRKNQVLKININGRVMVDPAIHRRINPNYPISTVKRKDDQDIIDVDDGREDCGCGHSSSSDGGVINRCTPPSSEEGPDDQRKKYRMIKDEGGGYRIVEIDAGDANDAMIPKEKLADRKCDIEERFSDEELLVASPVVLGFAFSEKLWLEFTVSGITDVAWNEDAFDSLVLPENQKSIVKALVSSHAFHPSRSIDDIISGKGKGLVAVLHGPPGTGKTLTAEGIADLLKCPLYMVSAGDLGTDPRTLEKELQNILDIAHSWGALLLLDEADVFLEKRSIHDIHRNALVSIFLRLLEYFQGILFLTSNRVETFDEAFVSRIHLSLRYGELSNKAKKTVWKMFIERVRLSVGMEVEDITEADFNDLAKRSLNGRQIKNLTRAAQALAVYEGVPLGLGHIRRVTEVAETFEMDLKGGTGYMDAMRGYT